MAQFGALTAQYKQKHEPLYYCHKRGASPRWFGPTNEVTVWDQARARVNEYHPTQKPVKLLERLITIFTDPGDVVIDPVAGSGATLIAAENTGRKGIGFEIKKDFYTKGLAYQSGLF
jgi:DNA modification methylase